MNPLRLLPGPGRLWRRLVPAASVVLLAAGCASRTTPTSALRHSLTFHASFDHGLDADFAVGARGLSNAPSLKERDAAVAGLPAGGQIQLAAGEGVFGNALKFTRNESPLLFYRAAGNAGYRTNNWSGTVSFWLRVDPLAQLAPGYCDPLQITPRAWNDAAFFLEFEKRTNDIPFRLGIYPNLPVWNPTNRRWEDMTPAEKPLLTVPNPPFSGSRWTHVVFTFENFNTGRDDGVAQLYLDGVAAGSIPARRQTFTWDEAQALMMMGVGYVGLWDELSVFNRSLTAEEVGLLHRLPGGVQTLHP